MATDNASPTSDKKKTDPAVLVALISLVGTIIGLLFAFPPFQRLFEPKPTTTTEPMLTATFVHTATATATETYTFVPTETSILAPSTETATVTHLPTSELPVGMQVSLVANQTRGRPPLRVKFNTKDTYFRDAAGNIFPCGACNYTWQVRKGSNTMHGPQSGQATFEYTFRDRGTYFVTVEICRNQSGDCGSTGAQIVVE